MSTMQTFYTDIAKCELEAGAGKDSTQKQRLSTAVTQEAYQQLLARLTQVTLAELNRHRTEMGWSAWW